MIIGPKEEVDELAEEAIDAASKKKNIRLCVALFFFFFVLLADNKKPNRQSRRGKTEENSGRAWCWSEKSAGEGSYEQNPGWNHRSGE